MYLVTDEAEKCRSGLQETVRQAVAGGVSIAQYRTVKTELTAILSELLPMRDFLRKAGVPLIINNNVDLAVMVGTDGIHIGQKDMPVAEARRRIGKDMILGLSVSTHEQMTAVDATLVDYVGCGPVFPTISKLNAPEPLGIEAWVELAAICPVSVVAIGGLDAARAAAIRATDYATDGDKTIACTNGHVLLTRVTGTGCAMGALAAACAACTETPLNAAAATASILGVAGEQASERCPAPGGFATALLDELYTLTPESVAARARFS